MRLRLMMQKVIAVLTEPEYVRYRSFMLGGVAAYTGIDGLLPLPRGVHWAVGGVVPHVMCKIRADEPVEFNSELILSGALGVAGGFATSYLIYSGIF